MGLVMQELDRLLFKFRSGTHGLDKEEDKSECGLCGAEYESIVHVL